MSVITMLALLPAPVAAEPSAEDAGWFIMLLTIFILALFVGFEIITKVPPTLHTPLMSGSNAISGITLVGALLLARSGLGWLSGFLAFVAITLATINVIGGYAVTHRMLRMFQRRRR
jgi:H+-translocating NAD(P) transhydrogenase subunit alpha